MAYRVGIVGSAFGGTVHAPAFALHPQFEVVAIASPANAERVARERKIPHAFPSVDAMLAGTELDVISVASPPFDHLPSVLAALAAGKHVLCEKPFALSVAEAEELVAAAQRAGTACAIAHEFRYCAAPIALHEMREHQHLERLREIEVTSFREMLRADNPNPRSAWWYSRERGGGIGNAVMPHLIDMASWLAGRPPLTATGLSRTANPNRHDAAGDFTMDAADGTFALVDYGDGLVARITADATASMTQTTLALHAEHRTAVASGAWFTEMQLFSVEPDEQSELELAASPYDKYVSVGASIPPFLALLDAFAERIATGGGNAPTFADGLATQRVLAAAGYGA
jgi:predicted dehydrogenase